jgi:ABC-2 type transport system ATP-binding protein
VDAAIDISHVTKWFRVSHGYRDLVPFRKRGQVRALNDVTLQVPREGIFGLLGPNGAGKTSLFKVLAGLYLPTQGTALVNGHDIVADRDRAQRFLMYAVSDERSFFWRLTGRQNLDFFAALYGVPSRERRRRIEDALELLGLHEAADRRVMDYSSGMKQRLSLSRALLGDPEILLLDEPTRSLDPLVSRDLWRFVRQELVTRQGKTVLVATHDLLEAREVFDRVAVLDKGEVKAVGSVDELTGLLGTTEHRFVLTLHPSSNGVSRLLAQLPMVEDLHSQEARDGMPYIFDFRVKDPQQDLPAIIGRLTAAGGYVTSYARKERSLSDVMHELTRAPSS